MNKLITSTDFNGNVSESYKTLRTNLMFRNFDKELKLINIVSTTPSEGKSSVISNLANVYAQLGKMVLLVDFDLRKPSIHHKLGIRNTVGINDFLSGISKLEDVVRKYDNHFYVITSGTKTIYYNELIQSENLKNFLEKMKENFDLIFIDCPPIGLISDGVILSSLCDCTLFVVENDAIDKRAVLRAYEQLKVANANVIGTIMTKVDVSKGSYGYQKYGYSYGYGEEEPKKKSKFSKRNK